MVVYFPAVAPPLAFALSGTPKVANVDTIKDEARKFLLEKMSPPHSMKIHEEENLERV